MESPVTFKESEVNDMFDSSLESLPLFSENFSTSSSSESNLYSETHANLCSRREWDAADKEYMDITGEETDIEYIDSLDDDINKVIEDNVEKNSKSSKTTQT